MNKSFDLLSLGEVLLRLSPPSNERLVRGETLQKQVGGAELNVVSGVSLLGLRTGIISKLPSNDIGTYAKNRIRFCGVSDDYLVYDTSPEARLGIYYYENGAYPRKPGVVYDRRHSTINTISIDDFDESLFSSARCFHTSGITLALSEQCRNTAIEMIRRFKDAGALISFDVNFRGNLWTGDEARECIEQILPYVDIFFCSEETARLTFLKTGEAKEIMKSFKTIPSPSSHPPSAWYTARRCIHSAPSSTTRAAADSSKKNRITTSKSWTASAAATPMYPACCTASCPNPTTARELWRSETQQAP